MLVLSMCPPGHYGCTMRQCVNGTIQYSIQFSSFMIAIRNFDSSSTILNTDLLNGKILVACICRNVKYFPAMVKSLDKVIKPNLIVYGYIKTTSTQTQFKEGYVYVLFINLVSLLKIVSLCFTNHIKMLYTSILNLYLVLNFCHRAISHLKSQFFS